MLGTYTVTTFCPLLYVTTGRSCVPFASKINVTPKCVYLRISKLYSILAVANLLA